ncbi:unnamed protein product [Ectocarpus sp. CCAP 1310/34]|nr:unnamed protein product [Ectocarpus sp. CCAP 1310/34]
MQGWSFRLTQTILLELVLFQIFVALQPAHHYWRHLNDLASTTSFGGYNKEPWLDSASPSCLRAYLSWCYMNTMLNVWECVGGAWLLDTKLMIFIYRRMGAKITWTTSISVFIRDFDSVDVQAGANVGGNLYVRRFEASCMDVKPIMIGEGADIRTGSVVYGGASVGDHWHHQYVAACGGPAHGGVSLNVPGPCVAIPCLIELVKLFSILCAMVAMTTMTYIPTILYKCAGLSGKFRCTVLVKIIFLVAGVPSQLALYIVLLKWALTGTLGSESYVWRIPRCSLRWILAGRVTEGSCQPTTFQNWRRWYLGRLNTLAFAYLHPFNRCPRYEWWAAALGVKAGRGSVVLLQGYNPEDAHLVEVIVIGSKALVGFRAHLSAGCTVGNDAMPAVCLLSTMFSVQLGGYFKLRPREHLPDGSVTTCDQQGAFQLRGTARTSPAQSDVHEDSGDAVRADLIDAACTVGACSLNILALVASFEATKLAASLWSRGDSFDTRVAVLSTVALVVWALASAMLLAVFKWVFVGDFCRMLPEDIESGSGSGQQETQRRKPNKLTASQGMRWRWMHRLVYFSVFETHILNTVLRGTWLLNVWLRLMGADVSMSALILGKVADHGMVKLLGFSMGTASHLSTESRPSKWRLLLKSGERAVVHAHTASFCTEMRTGSTMTAGSATLSGKVLQARDVFGGRPPKAI